jgi:hypothetical protein
VAVHRDERAAEVMRRVREDERIREIREAGLLHRTKATKAAKAKRRQKSTEGKKAREAAVRGRCSASWRKKCVAHSCA